MAHGTPQAHDIRAGSLSYEVVSPWFEIIALIRENISVSPWCQAYIALGFQFRQESSFLEALHPIIPDSELGSFPLQLPSVTVSPVRSCLASARTSKIAPAPCDIPLSHWTVFPARTNDLNQLVCRLLDFVVPINSVTSHTKAPAVLYLKLIQCLSIWIILSSLIVIFW